MRRIIKDCELKECELEILKYIHDICEKNALRYYLAYGTLIGAVRHKGFIPWDDDIDIAMPRKDFIQFCKLVSENDRYTVVSTITNGKYAVPFAKILDNRTELIQHYNFIERVKLGVYVDVFILDGFPTVSEEMRVHILNIEKVIKKWYWANTGFRATHNFIYNLIRFGLTTPYRIRGARYYAEKIDDILSKYDFDSCTIVTDASSLDPLVKCTQLRKVYGKGVLLDFENGKFFVPERYDDYLSMCYGDYMIIPNVDDRQSNHKFEAYWID